MYQVREWPAEQASSWATFLRQAREKMGSKAWSRDGVLSAVDFYDLPYKVKHLFLYRQPGRARSSMGNHLGQNVGKWVGDLLLEKTEGGYRIRTLDEVLEEVGYRDAP